MGYRLGLRRRPSRRAATSMGSPELRSRRLTRIWIQERAEPGQRLLVVIPATADIADPSGEVRHEDEFLTQPGKVGNETQAHDASLTFLACKRTGRLFRYRRLRHLNL
jgi:hypothetical protein